MEDKIFTPFVEDILGLKEPKKKAPSDPSKANQRAVIEGRAKLQNVLSGGTAAVSPKAIEKEVVRVRQLPTSGMRDTMSMLDKEFAGDHEYWANRDAIKYKMQGIRTRQGSHLTRDQAVSTANLALGRELPDIPGNTPQEVQTGRLEGFAQRRATQGNAGLVTPYEGSGSLGSLMESAGSGVMQMPGRAITRGILGALGSTPEEKTDILASPEIQEAEGLAGIPTLFIPGMNAATAPAFITQLLGSAIDKGPLAAAGETAKGFFPNPFEEGLTPMQRVGRGAQDTLGALGILHGVKAVKGARSRSTVTTAPKVNVPRETIPDVLNLKDFKPQELHLPKLPGEPDTIDIRSGLATKTIPQSESQAGIDKSIEIMRKAAEEGEKALAEAQENVARAEKKPPVVEKKSLPREKPVNPLAQVAPTKEPTSPSKSAPAVKPPVTAEKAPTETPKGETPNASKIEGATAEDGHLPTPPGESKGEVSAAESGEGIRKDANQEPAVQGAPKEEVAPKKPGFGMKRSFMLGGNKGARNTGTFASELHRDLYDLGAKLRGKRGAEGMRALDPEAIKNARLQLKKHGIDPAKADEMATSVYQDANAQAKAAGDAVDFAIKDNSGAKPKGTKPPDRFDTQEEKDQAKAEFNRKWNEAYGGRPETESASNPPTTETPQPELTMEEARKFAKMTPQEFEEYQAKQRARVPKTKLESIHAFLDDLIEQTDPKKNPIKGKESGATNLPAAVVHVAAKGLKAALTGSEKLYEAVSRFAKEHGLSPSETALALAHAKTLNEGHGLGLDESHFGPVKAVVSVPAGSTKAAMKAQAEALGFEEPGSHGMMPESEHLARGRQLVESGEIDPVSAAEEDYGPSHSPTVDQLDAMGHHLRQLKEAVDTAKTAKEIDAAIAALREYQPKYRKASNIFARFGHSIQAGSEVNRRSAGSIIGHIEDSGGTVDAATAEKLKDLTAKYRDLEDTHNRLLSEQAQGAKADTANAYRQRATRAGNAKAAADKIIARSHSDLAKAFAKAGANPVLDPEVLKAAANLVHGYVLKGAATVDEAVSSVIADIKDKHGKDLSGSERQIRDAFSRYNPEPPKAKSANEAVSLIRQAQKEGRLLSAIEDWTNGLGKPGTPPPAASAKIKALVKQLNELKGGSDRFAKLQATLDKAQSGIFEKRPKTIDPADIADIKAQIQELRGRHNYQETIADLKEQLRSGEFKDKRKQKGRSPEMEELAYQRFKLQQQIDQIIQSRKPKSGWEIAANVANLPRSLIFSGDMSGALRQNLWFSASHPIVSGKAFVQATRAMFSDRWAVKVDSDMRAHKDFASFEKHGGYASDLGSNLLGAREEQFMSNIGERIPILKHVILGSERHMITLLNKTRFDMYRQFLKDFPNASTEAKKAYANYVNAATGRGNLGNFSRAGAALSNAFISPRLAVSRFQTPLTVAKLFKAGEREVGLRATQDLVKVVATGVGALKLAQAGGAEVSFDPDSPDFGKIKIGNTRFDIWGGFQQPLRLVARLLKGAYMGEIAKIDPIDLVTRYLTYKTSPLVTNAYWRYTGKDLVGNKLTGMDLLKKNIIFANVQEMMDTAKSKGWLNPTTAATGAAGILGISTSTYQEKQKKTSSSPLFKGLGSGLNLSLSP